MTSGRENRSNMKATTAALGLIAALASAPVAAHADTLDQTGQAATVPAGYSAFHLREYRGLSYLRAIQFETPKRLVHTKRPGNPNGNRQFKWHLPANLYGHSYGFMIYHAYVPNGCMDTVGTTPGSAIKVNPCDLTKASQYWRAHKRVRQGYGVVTYTLENVQTKQFLTVTPPEINGRIIARLQAYQVPPAGDQFTTDQELLLNLIPTLP
jgi:hypothetical protein